MRSLYAIFTGLAIVLAPAAAAAAPAAAAAATPAAAAAPARLDPPLAVPAIVRPALVNVAWGDAPDLDRLLPRLIAAGYFAALAQYGVGTPVDLGERPASPACGASAPPDVRPATVAAFVVCEAATGTLPNWPAGQLVVNVFLPAATTADFDAPEPCYGSRDTGAAGLLNYHGNTGNFVAGVAIPYAVVAAGCADADGGGTFGSPGAHLSWALTHEDVEAMTDPVPGLGWIDRTLGGEGEAADLCEADGGPYTAYWSNAAGACVRPGVGPPVPADAPAAPATLAAPAT